ncbi:MAG: septum formation initiator family protein [Rhizobiales bacterium]|nr:septum formation initiator family protein [Hyphomicrobiales bacterium]
MSTRYKNQSIFKRLLLPALTALIVAYFSFHAKNGRHGMLALEAKQLEIMELDAVKTMLLERRKFYTSRVELLDLAAIDPDLLDERARQLLGYVRPDELLIYIN